MKVIVDNSERDRTTEHRTILGLSHATNQPTYYKLPQPQSIGYDSLGLRLVMEENSEDYRRHWQLEFAGA
jgi:hypothetical protein